MVEQRHAASHQRQAKARLGWFDPCVAQRSWLRRGADPRDACCIPVGNGPAENVRWQRAVQFRWRLLAGTQRAKQQRAGLLGLGGGER